jgi:hypothetical protein
MEHQIGNELILGNNSFYNGQVFDGIAADADWDSWSLGLFLFKLAETEDFPGGVTSNDDVNLYGLDFSFALGQSNLTPYYLYLHDGANGALRKNISTLGILWNRPTVDNDGWDLNLELAGQFGETGTDAATVDQGGILFEGWFGWTFGNAGRLHIGYLYASGDDGSDPTQNDGWNPLFEDGHAYNRLGNLDLFNANLRPTGLSGMTNVSDLSLGYTWAPGEDSKHSFFAALHQFNLDESGAADDDLGLEFDVTYSYEIVHNSTLQIGVGYLSAGDALGPLADDTTRLWVQIESSWGKAKPWTSIGQQSGWMN